MWGATGTWCWRRSDIIRSRRRFTIRVTLTSGCPGWNHPAVHGMDNTYVTMRSMSLELNL
jgi:hypothetical protein